MRQMSLGWSVTCSKLTWLLKHRDLGLSVFKFFQLALNFFANTFCSGVVGCRYFTDTDEA